MQSHREERVAEGAFYPSFSPDGKTIAVDASWGIGRRIWIIGTHGENPQQLTSDSSDAVAHYLPHWSPDGKKIVYQRTERTKYNVALVDVVTRQSSAVTNDNYREINPAFGGDGKSIYFSSDRGGGMNLWRVSIGADGKPNAPPQQLTSGAGQDIQIAISRDGKRLAYTTQMLNADIWRLPLNVEGTAAGAP